MLGSRTPAPAVLLLKLSSVVPPVCAFTSLKDTVLSLEWPFTTTLRLPPNDTFERMSPKAEASLLRMKEMVLVDEAAELVMTHACPESPFRPEPYGLL